MLKLSRVQYDSSKKIGNIKQKVFKKNKYGEKKKNIIKNATPKNKTKK